MHSNHSPYSPLQFRVPAVRHLAWMCGAPQLIVDPSSFDIAGQLPPDTPTILRHWDRKPEDGPALLKEVPHPRLGLYFENLYACLLEDLMGWDILARNLQIKGLERTLGELDFVVRNPHTGTTEHHEIAVKFYLGYPSPKRPLWYGPNARDRLDLKTRRLREHQGRMTHRPETAAALRTLGIKQQPVSRLYMPGYLFYPQGLDMTAPEQAPAHHLRGTWLYWAEAKNRNTEHWVPLHKPHWLGPWVQTEAPDPRTIQDSLDTVDSTGTPRLFARLTFDPAKGFWVEAERTFVVPEHWPG